MFSVVSRPAARAVLKAARPAAAARAFTASALVKSDHGPKPPTLLGPGIKAGEVPSAYDQTTGLERLQLLGEIEGINVFDQEPLDSSRVGTKADPIVITSLSDNRIVGCTGSPADSHDVEWFVVNHNKQRRCHECGSVYVVENLNADSEHAHH
ncbi:COX5B-domain-containing protein [Cylindrobasidium torrendii FP15055 ss-10]|uniref:COX5B-domain-containing protein n=1 Tax=Cylindrobasidium torrendii FP15055 ss-10 TaxID=1314674 RepID=A0A0D7BMV4_9AGAR|nr:COX5B-domain-containing protein [Cylindrobasidium torrendii FP15055 ss-10]